MITNETKIRNILTNHYETLFKKETTDENAQNEIFKQYDKTLEYTERLFRH